MTLVSYEGLVQWFGQDLLNLGLLKLGICQELFVYVSKYIIFREMRDKNNDTSNKAKQMADGNGR